MAHFLIVDNTVLQAPPCSKLLLTVNAALTGTILISDATSGSAADVATITNPAVGSQFIYYDMKNGSRITASGACNITVNTSGTFGSH